MLDVFGAAPPAEEMEGPEVEGGGGERRLEEVVDEDLQSEASEQMASA